MYQEKQNLNAYPANADSTYPVKKRKQGFWANIFGRSSDEEEANNGRPPKRKPLINSILTTLRNAVAKEALHVAEDEVKKNIESNSSQPSGANTAPDAQTTQGNDTTDSTPWTKRIMDNAQQRVQNLPSF